ncbi:MAG: hypothetical protein JRI25_18520 [Deltaproteobacteria bacterium]|nr:hypothetical protein [Deltaproteobacteria bacterium]MBW2256573.1 hypothetical protein [Deltaproteobacteria bacterium]
MSNGYPTGFSVAVVGADPDYGFWTCCGGNAVVCGRAGGKARGAVIARALADLPLPDPMNTTAAAQTYAKRLSEHLAASGDEAAGVDLLVLHREEAGLGGWCIGSAGAWAIQPSVQRCTPDRTVGAQLRMLGAAVDERTAHLHSTRILARGIEGGDVFYGAGNRFVALIGWPLPTLDETLPAELGSNDDTEVLATLVRLVHRRCAHGLGLVAVWTFE